VMAADRPYGEFYEFYSVSPEYFGYFSYMSPKQQTAFQNHINTF
jgi:hypothetical protein